jgi:predicted metal-dependent peptidase
MTRDRVEVAEEIVAHCRMDLCTDLRFMTQPVLTIETVVLSGDGMYYSDSGHLYFYADRVIEDFKTDPNIISRVIAHMVLHLVLGHLTKNEDPLRDLAEDMIVEYALDMLETPHTSTSGKDDRIFIFERIQKKAGAPLVDLIAAELAEVSEWQMNTYPPLFRTDGHDHRDGRPHPEWQEISAQMMVEIEGFSKNLSDKSGALMRVLRLHNRKKTDYRAFLRKFMTTRERVKLDLNEFDPAYYAYGLSLYGNIPFLDAVEFSNSPMVEDFVIAVDTSGSTMKGPVVKFIEDVYSIMEQCEISRRTNLHIIQCDEDVRSDTVIRSRADMGQMLNEFELLGGKGTDFRPVFYYVDNLIEEGQFSDLRGLIYFTDGMGTYPHVKPSYPVAFLFCDDRFLDREVPPWAIKVMIGTNQLAE